MSVQDSCERKQVKRLVLIVMVMLSVYSLTFGLSNTWRATEPCRHGTVKSALPCKERFTPASLVFWPTAAPRTLRLCTAYNKLHSICLAAAQARDTGELGFHCRSTGKRRSSLALRYRFRYRTCDLTRKLKEHTVRHHALCTFAQPTKLLQSYMASAWLRHRPAILASWVVTAGAGHSAAARS